MAIQIGRANLVWRQVDTAGTNIDANFGFTPTAGKFFVLAYHGGSASATDSVGGGHVHMGVGFAASSTERRGVAGHTADAQGTSGCDQTHFDDAILKVLEVAGGGAVSGALDFAGVITNGVRFTVDDQINSGGPDIRFQVIIIDGLTDAAIVDITEPASTGNADHTGFGIDNAELFFFLHSGFNTGTLPSVGTQIQFSFGVGHADGQGHVELVSRDNQATSSTFHYGNNQEVLSIMNVLGAPVHRASFVSGITDGVRLNWLEVGGAGTEKWSCAALKGIEATVQEALTETNTTTDIVVTGLGNTCLGGLVLSTCEAENAQDTSGTHHHFSIGSFKSTTDRGAHATWDESGLGTTETAVAVEYDEVYANIATDDTIQGLMDIKSLDSGGATFIMDDADPAQKWFLAILFATPPAAIGVDEMMAARQWTAVPVRPIDFRHRTMISAAPALVGEFATAVDWLPTYPGVIQIEYEPVSSGEKI